jgi:hypothetical protein
MSVIDRETEKRHKKMQKTVQPEGLPSSRFNHPSLKTQKTPESKTAKGSKPTKMKNLSISMVSKRTKTIVEVPLDAPSQILIHQEFSDEAKMRRIRQSSNFKIRDKN